MIMEKQTRVTKDLNARKIIVEREFDAPVQDVWRAWTEKELLDQWWAPRPWKAETRSLDFREGGSWLYCMKGPEGEASWCRADFKTINKHKSFTSVDNFCDESGKVDGNFPNMYWKTEFIASGPGTKVIAEISFDSEADLQKILELGFEEGFKMALGNLDELLQK